MRAEIKRAAASTTAPTIKQRNEGYSITSPESKQKRQEKINQRLDDMPKIYRRFYQQAVKGVENRSTITPELKNSDKGDDYAGKR
jgi:hypothetical protein